MNKLMALILLLSPSAFAGYQNCPKDWVAKNPQTYKLLKSLEGPSKLGSCGLEIHICDRNQDEAQDALVGDIMIVYMHQPIYIPLYINQEGEASVSDLVSDSRSVTYYFADQNRDPYAGDNERDNLRILLDQKSGELQQITVRVSTRHDYTNVLFWKLPRSVTCQKP